MHICCDPVFPFLRTHMSSRNLSTEVVRVNLFIITKQQNTQISINRRMNSGIFIQWNAI